MRLPGGYWDGFERHRGFAFRSITGAVELAIAEAAASDTALPRKVTVVLTAALDHLGGEPAGVDRVHHLAVGDRQFLMRRLAHRLGTAANWLTASCRKCGSPFDLFVDQSDLPTKEAGDTFPYATVDTRLGRCRVRVPTGADQEATASIGDDRAAVHALARRCVVEIDDDDEAMELGEEDIARIDAALEAVAPEVTTVADTACPDCAHVNHVYVDPYACLTTGSDALFDEIHQLATTYHWAEQEILGLPRDRRRTYLQRIDRGWGTAQALEEVESLETWE